MYPGSHPFFLPPPHLGQQAPGAAFPNLSGRGQLFPPMSAQSRPDFGDLLLTTAQHHQQQQQQHDRRSILSPPESPKTMLGAGQHPSQPLWPLLGPPMPPNPMFPFGFPPGLASNNIGNHNNNNPGNTLPNNFLASLYFSSLMKAMQATDGSAAIGPFGNFGAAHPAVPMPPGFPPSLARPPPPPPPPPPSAPPAPQVPPSMDPGLYARSVFPHLYRPGHSLGSNFGPRGNTATATNNNSNDNEVPSTPGSMSQTSSSFQHNSPGSVGGDGQQQPQQHHEPPAPLRKSRFSQMQRVIDLSRFSNTNSVPPMMMMSPIEGKHYWFDLVRIC